MEFIIELILHLVAVYPGAFIIWTIKGYKGKFTDILERYDLFSLGTVGILSILVIIILGVVLT